MMNTDLTFHEGDEILLAEGSYQGTQGVFSRFTEDPNWAVITESSGTVRNHPLAWLAHPQSAFSGAASTAL
jgi:hypothetical protein